MRGLRKDVGARADRGGRPLEFGDNWIWLWFLSGWFGQGLFGAIASLSTSQATPAAPSSSVWAIVGADAAGVGGSIGARLQANTHRSAVITGISDPSWSTPNTSTSGPPIIASS